MVDESKPPHWLGVPLKGFILKYVPKVPKSNNELITYKTNENRNTVLADF